MPKLTETPGNPAHALRAEYASLMTIEDPEALRARALEIVSLGGISPANKKKFLHVVRRESSLVRLQQFLTNWMLKADGLGVI